MRLKSKREQAADAIAAVPPIAQFELFARLAAAYRAHRDGAAPTLTDEQRRVLRLQRRALRSQRRALRLQRRALRLQRRALRSQRRRKGPRRRFKHGAASAALLFVLAFGTGCAGVTAADLEPHVATARDLARRNNAAIAVHCVGMPLEDRQALIRDNIDHAAQLAALQQSADDGPGWISQVIAWALSFSRLAGIVAADPQLETAENAMDGNPTDPDAPAPDDDGEG